MASDGASLRKSPASAKVEHAGDRQTSAERAARALAQTPAAALRLDRRRSIPRSRRAAMPPLRRLAGSTSHAPARHAVTSTTASGTIPAAITSAWLAVALGPSTRKTGSDISTRSNSACSVIVGKQPEAQEDEAPDQRRPDQFDEPRIRRKARIVGVGRAEDHGLQHEREADREAAMAEARTDQRRQRQRHRAEQAFLHESRLQRHADRCQRRQRAAENVRIGQRLRWLPPAEIAVGDEIERDDKGELDRHEQIAADRASEHRRRRRRVARPQPPQLRMIGERLPGQGSPPP